MARRNPELEERRENVRKLLANANRKVARTSRVHSANIAGTKLDVRPDSAKIGRYNMTQLNNVEAKLMEFNSRGTQFFGAANGEIFTGKEWREYKHLETLGNARSRKWDEGVGDVFIKQSGMTVSQRKEAMKSTVPKAAGESTPRLFFENNLKPGQVNGKKALQKLIKQQKDRLKGDYVNQEIKKGRASFNSMLNAMGNLHLVSKLNELTDHQFAILVKETNFADSVGLKYTTLAQMAAEDEKSGEHDKYLDSVADTESGVIDDFLHTAKSYPERPAKKSRKKKSSS